MLGNEILVSLLQLNELEADGVLGLSDIKADVLNRATWLETYGPEMAQYLQPLPEKVLIFQN